MGTFADTVDLLCGFRKNCGATFGWQLRQALLPAYAGFVPVPDLAAAWERNGNVPVIASTRRMRILTVTGPMALSNQYREVGLVTLVKSA